MENERTRSSLIQEAVLAALGCTKIDYRSPRRMDEAAAQIAAFVENALIRGATCDQQIIHASDCAVNNAPAFPVGSCNCGAKLAASDSPPKIAAVRLVSVQDTPSTHDKDDKD